MQNQPAGPAGGAWKNQMVTQVIELPAGHYRLRYKSDSGHAFNYWDSLPTDNFFWASQFLACENFFKRKSGRF